MSSRGRPILTLRLDRATISALKISARRHDTTVSDLVRALIDEQLEKDGIDRSGTNVPISGQRDIDDYIMDAETCT